jgi:hypothetical protein
MSTLGVVELVVLPVVKDAVKEANKSASRSEAGDEGWVLEPEEVDATMSIPASMIDDDDRTMIGRLCYLGPKVWLLCCVHCTALSSAGIALSNASAAAVSTSFLGILALCFPAWCTLFLAAGVLEAVVRRYVWLRLLEHGLMLQPAGVEQSTEYRAMVGGLVVMAVSAWATLGADGNGTATTIVGAASGMVILHNSWVTPWRLPSAVSLLTGGGGVSFVAQITCVSETSVAQACAALAPGATSFAKLGAHIRAAETARQTAGHPASESHVAHPTTEWAVRRNWAMRFMGVPPPIVALRCVLGCELPVRTAASFHSAKDRAFARRMQLWNGATMAISLAVQLNLALYHGVSTSQLLATGLLLALAACALVSTNGAVDGPPHEPPQEPPSTDRVKSE